MHDLQRLSAAEAVALEPALHCAGAVLSPTTGIVDSHGLMLALLGDAENAGALLALRAPLRGAERDGDGWRVHTGGDEPFDAAHTLHRQRRRAVGAGRGASLAGFPAAAMPRAASRQGPLLRARPAVRRSAA